MSGGLRFPERLVHELERSQLDRLLLWCVGMGGSDVVFCPGDPVWMQKDGVWIPVSDSALTETETQAVVDWTTSQPSRSGYVRAGHSIDYAYSLRAAGGRAKQRFRVNATSTTKSVYVVMRALPRSIPTLKDMEGLDEGIVEALYPENGLVVVSGVMGSGKSTLLAATLHSALRSGAAGRQILTLEDPVEFDFSTIPACERRAPVAQSAVFKDVESWPAGVRSMTRRKGEIVMIGESRDEETLSALLSCVDQGVCAYTTVHARDVPQTASRIINAFPEAKRDAVAASLKASLRLVVHQRLVRRSERATGEGTPGRIALREYLSFDATVRRELAHVPRNELDLALRRLVRLRGKSLLEDATEKHRRGLVDDAVLEAIEKEQGGEAPAGQTQEARI